MKGHERHTRHERHERHERHGHRCRPRGHHRHPEERRARELELADDLNLTGDRRELFIRIRRETHAIHHALVREVDGDRAAVHHHLEHLRDLTRAKLDTFLDADQRATLDAHHERKRARRRERRLEHSGEES